MPQNNDVQPENKLKFHVFQDERSVDLNLYQYGQALIERCGGSLTAYGLIEREDHQPVQTMENKPSQGGMEML